MSEKIENMQKKTHTLCVMSVINSSINRKQGRIRQPFLSE